MIIDEENGGKLDSTFIDDLTYLSNQGPSKDEIIENLEQELSSCNAELTEVMDELNQCEEDLNRTVEQLDGIEESINRLENQLDGSFPEGLTSSEKIGAIVDAIQDLPPGQRRLFAKDVFN